MKKSVQMLISVVSLNFLLFASHGLAHFGVNVIPSVPDTVFIVLVIGLAPILGLYVALRGSARTGALILAGSMGASLIYGLYNHFISQGTDNAFGLLGGAWSQLFLITALLLLATETAGLIAGVLLSLSCFHVN